MRIVFYGLGELTKSTAVKFVNQNHDVIIIEPDKGKVKEFSETVDCGFLIGEASQPAILKEVNPEQTDLFFALSENNQNNIVACLVARSLGVDRTILRIDDADYEEVCKELGLEELVVPSAITSQYLFDEVLNEKMLEMFQYMKDRLCLYVISITQELSGAISNLGLPSGARVACYFRENEFSHYNEGDKLKEGDEAIIIASDSERQSLTEKFNNAKTTNP